MKTCLGCGEDKDESEYYKSKGYLMSKCKRCHSLGCYEDTKIRRQSKISRKFWYAPEVLPEESDPLFLKFEEYYRDAVALGISQQSAGLIAVQMLNAPVGTLDGTSGSNELDRT